jgi:hypothetical protein
MANLTLRFEPEEFDTLHRSLGEAMSQIALRALKPTPALRLVDADSGGLN